jgi:hypothetical protein
VNHLHVEGEIMRLTLPLWVLGVALPVCSTGAAVNSYVFTDGKTGLTPEQFHSLNGLRDAAPPPVTISSFGDEALSSVQLAGTDGYLMINSHACSGPPLGAPAGAGSAHTGSHIEYEETFIIESATLPADTQVSINLKVGAARSFIDRLNIQTNPTPKDSATTSGSASIHFSTVGAWGTSFVGAFGGSQAYYDPASKTQTGIFAVALAPTGKGEPHAGEFTGTVNGLVGHPFTISLEATIGTDSGDFNPNSADADGQLMVAWGAEVAGGLAEIRSPTDDSLFPSTDNAGSDRALALLPRSPLAPEPAGLALILSCGIFLRRKIR